MAERESPSTADTAAPSPRRRSRLRLALLVAGGIFAAICFGGCLILSLFLQAERSVEPAEVLKAAQQICGEIALPDGYEGELAETIEAPIFLVRKTQFRHTSGKGVLSLVEMQIRWVEGEQNDEAVRKGLDQLVTEMRRLVVSEESTRTISIRGEPAEFHVSAGRDALSTTQLHEVRGEFRGAAGTAQLWLQAEDSIWDQPAVDRMLDSLTTP